MLGDVAQARVAGGDFRPGVADADHRPAVEHVVGQALALHPAAMDKPVAIQLSVAVTTAEPAAPVSLTHVLP